MVIKRPLTLSSAALGCIGLGLILGAFFLVVPPGQRNAVAWLDLLVCDAVFLVNFASLPLAGHQNDGFSREIPKLGVLWTTHALYTSLALGGIWYGWSADILFRFQLLYHLALLFGLLVIVSIAGRASDHAGRVEANEQQLRDSLQTLKTALIDCDGAFLRLGNGPVPEYSEFQRLKEDIRYLSPCNAPNAVSLDLEIACLLGDLCATLSVSNEFPPRGQTMQDTLTRCQTLVRLRKQERQD